MSPGLARLLGFVAGLAVSHGGLSLAGHLLRGPNQTLGLTAGLLLPILSGLLSGFATAWPWRGAWGGLLAGSLPHALAVGYGIVLMGVSRTAGGTPAAVFLLVTLPSAFLGAALETWAWRRKLNASR